MAETDENKKEIWTPEWVKFINDFLENNTTETERRRSKA